MNKSPSLTHLILEWINGDHILIRHFNTREVDNSSGVVYFDCSKLKPKTTMSEHYDLGRVVAKIIDTRVTVMFHQHEFYKFHAAHPLFFQKLRGHIYDMHNRNRFSCSEYLR